LLSVGCSLLLPAMTSSSAEHTRPAERPVAHGCWRVTSLPGPCPSSVARSTSRTSRDSPLTRRKRVIHPHSPSRVSLSSRPVSGCSVAVPTGPLQRSRARPRCGRSLRYATRDVPGLPRWPWVYGAGLAGGRGHRVLPHRGRPALVDGRGGRGRCRRRRRARGDLAAPRQRDTDHAARPPCARWHDDRGPILGPGDGLEGLPSDGTQPTKTAGYPQTPCHHPRRIRSRIFRRGCGELAMALRVLPLEIIQVSGRDSARPPDAPITEQGARGRFLFPSRTKPQRRRRHSSFDPSPPTAAACRPPRSQCNERRPRAQLRSA